MTEKMSAEEKASFIVKNTIKQARYEQKRQQYRKENEQLDVKREDEK